jgi:hypothetical protein
MLLKRVFDKRNHGEQHSDCDANGAVLKASCCCTTSQKRGNEEAAKARASERLIDERGDES